VPTRDKDDVTRHYVNEQTAIQSIREKIGGGGSCPIGPRELLSVWVIISATDGIALETNVVRDSPEGGKVLS